MKKYLIYAAICIMASLCLAYANLSIPQCELSKDTEDNLSAVSALAFFAFLGPLIIGGIYRRNDKKYAAFFFAVFLVIAPATMTGSQRADKTQRNYWVINGIITDKFISNNHSSRSLIIAGKEYEFIPTEIWNEAEVGMIFTKISCGNVTLNGNEYIFLP